jgi:hypothetical protein
MVDDDSGDSDGIVELLLLKTPIDFAVDEKEEG